MAFFGNALIIPALRKLSSLHSPSKILISCLACTDLGVGLISNPLLNGYYFSRELQELSLLLGTFLYRYYDIMRRIFVNNDCNKCRQTSCSITRAKVQAGCNCEASNGPCCHYMAFQHPYRRGGMASAGLVLCIVISTFCYTKIYHTLRLSRAQLQDQGNQGQRNGEGSQLNKARYKKTVSTVVWIQMTLLACYLPFGLVGAVKAIFRLYVPSQSLIYAVTLSLLMSNSTINPLLYCWKIRDIRQVVRGTIRQFRCIFSEEA
ncbi:hypothetical protein pdam_00005245 [Pocillopora damicornis]|uniref:G-protein coupled receptors family 1 profile domain-containing protein n=1 Tax=Pocillopora damicornis TaxID=46731 RepID=A0A3M6T4S9_POCDA|nr:hypothetical protein pdam_00005245 [Pocillopora damicornis]